MRYKRVLHRFYTDRWVHTIHVTFVVQLAVEKSTPLGAIENITPLAVIEFLFYFRPMIRAWCTSWGLDYRFRPEHYTLNNT